MGHPPWYSVSLKSIDPGLSVGRHGMGLPLFNSTQPALEEDYSVRWCVTVVQCRSRSSKLVPIIIGTDSKRICDFLLVFHCNYVPIFYRF